MQVKGKAGEENSLKPEIGRSTAKVTRRPDAEIPLWVESVTAVIRYYTSITVTC